MATNQQQNALKLLQDTTGTQKLKVARRRAKTAKQRQAQQQEDNDQPKKEKTMFHYVEIGKSIKAKTASNVPTSFDIKMPVWRNFVLFKSTTIEKEVNRNALKFDLKHKHFGSILITRWNSSKPISVADIQPWCRKI